MRQRETVKDRISGQRTKADLLPCALHFQLIPTECPMTKILGAPLSPLCSGGCRPRLNMPIEFTTESGRSGGTVLAENVTRRMAIRRTDSPVRGQRFQHVRPFFAPVYHAEVAISHPEVAIWVAGSRAGAVTCEPGASRQYQQADGATKSGQSANHAKLAPSFTPATPATRPLLPSLAAASPNIPAVS